MAHAIDLESLINCNSKEVRWNGSSRQEIWDYSKMR